MLFVEGFEEDSDDELIENANLDDAPPTSPSDNEGDKKPNDDEHLLNPQKVQSSPGSKRAQLKDISYSIHTGDKRAQEEQVK